MGYLLRQGGVLHLDPALPTDRTSIRGEGGFTHTERDRQADTCEDFSASNKSFKSCFFE